MKTKFLHLFAFTYLIASLIQCSGSGGLGSSSQSGEIDPFVISDEVIKLAQKQHPEAVLLGVKSASTQLKNNTLAVSRYVNDSYVKPNGKASRWDFIFATQANAFSKQGSPGYETYTVATDKLFGIHYQDGKYFPIASLDFVADASYLGSPQGLKLPQTIQADKALELAKQEFQKEMSGDTIGSVAYSLQEKGIAWPPYANSWMDQTHKVTPVWEIVLVTPDGKKGISVFLDASSGEIAEKTQGFTVR